MVRVLRKKRWLILLIILLLFFIIIFHNEISLFYQFFSGNGIIVKLDADKEFLSLKHGETEEVNFETKVTTNPFCSANCSYIFRDIGMNSVIENGNFKLKTGFPFLKNYVLESPNKGVGQKLYRFEIKCSNEKKLFCPSTDIASTRAILVAMNYSLSDEELEIKEKIVKYIGNLKERYGILKGKIEALNRSYNLNEDKFGKFEELFKEEEYFVLEKEVEEFAGEVLDVEINVNESIEEYNSKVGKLKFIEESLYNLKNSNLNNNFVGRLNIVIGEFNSLNFEDDVNKVLDKVKELLNENVIEEEVNITANNVKEFNLTNMTEFNVIDVNVSLVENKAECCVLKKYSECCSDCKDSNYPVIFLHGHAVSEDLDAEYSLEAFNSLWKKLEGDGILYSGVVTSFTKKDYDYGSFGLCNTSMSFKVGYYFDLFHEPENYLVIQSKSESIDTYSIRLKELIDTVKYKTGKDKVNIIAFSMGGLVARNYVRVFGSENVDKTILIGTPNKGITGEIALGCGVVGNELECRDMNENSLFLNKLNSAKLDVEIHNIVGKGCKMMDGDGDGAVLEKNARLEDAHNYLIFGKCRSRVYPLHLDLLNLDLYPEVYEIIKNVLEE